MGQKHFENWTLKKKKLESFGWNVLEVNGHDHFAIYDKLKKTSETKPNAVIAHTTKGKGVSFMENKVLWHYRPPNKQELKISLSELK